MIRIERSGDALEERKDTMKLKEGDANHYLG
jgi:hypothetical protein